MAPSRQRSDTDAPVALPLRPQDETECRRCEVHCDKVVYPSACLDRACPFIYAYEEFGHKYMGCLQKIFAAEIDVHMLRAAERRMSGFGAVKAVKNPLPMCRAEVDECYPHRSDDVGCVNPEFNELPDATTTFRVFARLTD